jgi:hypothetical protein
VELVPGNLTARAAAHALVDLESHGWVRGPAVRFGAGSRPGHGTCRGSRKQGHRGWPGARSRCAEHVIGVKGQVRPICQWCAPR